MSGSEYAYAYGVVSGMSAKLITPRAFDELVMFRSVEEVTAYLEGTDYEPDLREAIGKRIDMEVLERSLTQHFRRIYQGLVSSLPQPDREELDRMVIGMFRVENLKMIMRGIHSGMEREELEAMLYPVMTPESVEDLLSSENVKEFVSKLEGQEKEALEALLEGYGDTGSLLPLENALDRIFLESWNTPAREGGRSLLRKVRRKKTRPDALSYLSGLKTDVTNMKTLLRCRLSDAECREHLIEGGIYTGDKLEALGKMDVNGLLSTFDDTPFGKECREGAEEQKETGSLSSLETRLDGKMVAILKEKAVFDPLSLISIILFVNQKWKEVRNIRTIAVCKHHGMEPQEIKKLMVN